MIRVSIRLSLSLRNMVVDLAMITAESRIAARLGIYNSGSLFDKPSRLLKSSQDGKGVQSSNEGTKNDLEADS
jgi:hypothetical protein